MTLLVYLHTRLNVLLQGQITMQQPLQAEAAALCYAAAEIVGIDSKLEDIIATPVG